jgi:hypothetical protein
MKKSLWMTAVPMMLLLIIVAITPKPTAKANLIPEPTRHKVFCADQANWKCEISNQSPYCNGVNDPEWSNPDYCPVPRGITFCPDGATVLCDVNDGAPYCNQHWPEWDNATNCPH